MQPRQKFCDKITRYVNAEFHANRDHN